MLVADGPLAILPCRVCDEAMDQSDCWDTGVRESVSDEELGCPALAAEAFCDLVCTHSEETRVFGEEATVPYRDE